nr:MAG TPA: hypothetical protein [Caudoviricetes sp.]
MHLTVAAEDLKISRLITLLPSCITPGLISTTKIYYGFP